VTASPAVASYVLVIGSANIDVSVSTAVLPRPGETVMGHGSLITLGGKGANQAVASAGGGATTHFVGCVGADAFGGMVRDGLRDRQVGIADLRAVADTATGLATICVDDSGKNCIVVVPGANAQLTPADLDALLPVIRGAAVLVLQCEIPMETVYRAIDLAAACGTQVILNPAPFRGLDLDATARNISYLVPNESEAEQLAGRPVETVDQAKDCATWLHRQGVECVIITLGAQGCVAADGEPARHYPGHRVAAIDTTGAGDAFIGCLAASLASGRSRDESIRRALLYSALSATRRGAQVSYPGREEFEQAWSNDKSAAGGVGDRAGRPQA
jgi:ribokinase